MDSKYNMLGMNRGNNSKLQLKLKPTPIIFNNKNGQSSPKKLKLSNNVLDSGRSVGIQNNDRGKPSIQEQKRNLPVYEQRNKLLQLIRRHNTLIIIGDTGCGKSTQIPQYILSARLQENGRIAVTQPRRVAAISIALRVAQEVGNGVNIFNK